MLIALVIGLGQTGYLSLGNVLSRAYVDDEYRGRVLSVYLMQFGLKALGIFAISIVASIVGARPAIGLSALILLALTVPLVVSRSRLLSLS